MDIATPDAAMLGWIGIIAMFLCLFLIPLGLPGLWIMVGILVLGAFNGMVGFAMLFLAVVIAAIAELLEFLVVKRLTARYGGSRKAFWGAILGGIIGMFVGAPVPIIGSLLAGILGSFIGALVVSWGEMRSLGLASRVGWGAVLGRVLSAVVKTGAGVAILVLGGAALLIE